MSREANYYRELGGRIQKARVRRGLTQEGLASLIDLTRTSVVNIEKGRQKVLAHTLVSLSRALKMDLAELARESTEDLKMDELLKGRPEEEKRFVMSAVTPGKKEK